MRDARQKLVHDWAVNAFGHVEANSLPQRGLRLLEEAAEAFQACGGTVEMAHQLVDYVFGRPVGELAQEIGGTSVTLLALSQAAGLSAEDEECREVLRVLCKPAEHFTQRNAAKNASGLRAFLDQDPMPCHCGWDFNYGDTCPHGTKGQGA